MRERIYFIFISLYFLIFISCKEKPQIDPDLWVGTTRVMDRNIPFPFLIEKTKMGTNLINHKNLLIDSTNDLVAHYNLMDTIKMQHHEFVVLKSSPNFVLFDLEDSLNFPYQHPLYAAKFVRAGNFTEVEFPIFLKNLKKNIYQTELESSHFATPNRDLKITKTLNFSEDKLRTIHRYFYNDELVYSEKEVTHYSIFQRQGKIFLSTYQEDDGPVILFQVSDADDDSFSLRTFRNNEEKVERFEISKESNSTENTVIFGRCMEGQPGEYYHDDLTYTKGNEYLIKKISRDAPAASGNGYITVHFTLNCKGEMGNLGLEQMNSEFQSTTFNPAFVKHIISEVMSLKDWPKIEPGFLYKDIHSFLMFRIKNGKINDLCP